MATLTEATARLVAAHELRRAKAMEWIRAARPDDPRRPVWEQVVTDTTDWIDSLRGMAGSTEWIRSLRGMAVPATVPAPRAAVDPAQALDGLVARLDDAVAAATLAAHVRWTCQPCGLTSAPASRGEVTAWAATHDRVHHRGQHTAHITVGDLTEVA